MMLSDLDKPRYTTDRLVPHKEKIVSKNWHVICLYDGMSIHKEQDNMKTTEKTHTVGAARVDAQRSSDWSLTRPSKVKFFKFDKNTNVIKKDLKSMTNRLNIFCSIAQENQKKNITLTHWEGKMKSKALKLAITAAAICLLLPNNTTAQTTAVTKSYGYLELINNGEAHNALPFHRREAYQGRVASVSGSTITLVGTPNFTANQFVFAPPARTNHFYMLIRSGSSEGEFFNVTANTANSITVSASMVGILSPGDIIAIIPKWSLNTIFPNGAYVYSASNASSAVSSGTTVHIYQRNNNIFQVRMPTSTPNHYNGSIWRTGPLTADRGNAVVFEPTDVYMIRHNNNPALLQIKEGWVEESDVAIMVHRDPTVRNMNVFGLPRPVNYSASEIGLSVSQSNVTGRASFTAFSSSRSDWLTTIDHNTSIIPKVPSSTPIWFNTSASQWRFGPSPANYNTNQVFLAGRAIFLVREPGSFANADIINKAKW